MRSLSWVPLIFICLFSFAVMAPSAQACGGGASDTIDRLLERTQIAVKARPVIVDSVRQNGVLAVESYLVGGPGPAFLFFSQTEPTLAEKIIEGAEGACHVLQKDLYVGDVGYFFLERRADGAYISTTYFRDENYFSFPQPDSTFLIYDSENTHYDLTEEAFVSLIAEKSGEEATAPDLSAPYPRYALLKITTREGKQYLLPIDTSIPIEVTDDLIRYMSRLIYGDESPGWNQQIFRPTVCPGEDCVPISPNGIYWAVPGAFLVEWPQEPPAQAILFSSTSDSFVVWSGTDLTVYPIKTAYGPPLPPMRSISLLGAPEAVGQAAWSPDGHQIAYSDAQGVWLMDVYAPDLPPRLLLATQGNTIPLARAFSPLGNYLSIENGTTWQNLDLVTGRYLPSGVFSSNERFLLAFDPAKSPFTLEICLILPALSCEKTYPISIRTGVDTYLRADQFMRVSWRDEFSFLALACVKDDMSTCFVDRRYLEGGGYWHDSEIYQQGTGYAYNPFYDDLVVITGERQLSINNKIYDLLLAEPIESVEWLPGLFYWR